MQKNRAVTFDRLFINTKKCLCVHWSACNTIMKKSGTEKINLAIISSSQFEEVIQLRTKFPKAFFEVNAELALKLRSGK